MATVLRVLLGAPCATRAALLSPPASKRGRASTLGLGTSAKAGSSGMRGERPHSLVAVARTESSSSLPHAVFGADDWPLMLWREDGAGGAQRREALSGGCASSGRKETEMQEKTTTPQAKDRELKSGLIGRACPAHACENDDEAIRTDLRLIHRLNRATRRMILTSSARRLRNGKRLARS